MTLNVQRNTLDDEKMKEYSGRDPMADYFYVDHLARASPRSNGQ